MRWGVIMWSALWPAGAFLVLGMLVNSSFNRLVSAISSGAGEAVAPTFLPAGVGAVLALIWIAIAWLRLKRWEAGADPECASCHGPLGFLRVGKVFYGKLLPDYRRCYNCGRANAEES